MTQTSKWKWKRNFFPAAISRAPRANLKIVISGCKSFFDWAVYIKHLIFATSQTQEPRHKCFLNQLIALKMATNWRITSRVKSSEAGKYQKLSHILGNLTIIMYFTPLSCKQCPIIFFEHIYAIVKTICSRCLCCRV